MFIPMITHNKLTFSSNLLCATNSSKKITYVNSLDPHKSPMITVDIMVIPILLMRKLRYTEVTSPINVSRESKLLSLTQRSTLSTFILCCLYCYDNENIRTNLSIKREFIKQTMV